MDQMRKELASGVRGLAMGGLKAREEEGNGGLQRGRASRSCPHR